jgi:hypothetical protein
VVVKL